MTTEMHFKDMQSRSVPPAAKSAYYKKTHSVHLTPETLSASMRAQSLRAKGLLPEIGAIVKPGTPKIDIAALRESLNAPIPNQGALGIRPGDTFDEAFQRLPTAQIRQYENNPRSRDNPAYLELKESIRSTKAKNVVLNVTRRPGDTHYICAAGGNTTLMVLQELWAETQDPAYATVKTLFTKWTGETDVIIHHLAENENRADICFWDKAKALVDLKARLETERGTGLMGIDTFIADIKSRGLSSNNTTVRAYIFAVEQLAPIGPWLTLPATKILQPRVNQLKKICQIQGIPVVKSDTLIRQTLEKQAVPLQEAESARLYEEITVDASAICEALDQAIATLTEMTVDELRALLAPAASHAGLNGPIRRDADRQDARLPQAVVREEATIGLPGPASESPGASPGQQLVQSSMRYAGATARVQQGTSHEKHPDEVLHAEGKGARTKIASVHTKSRTNPPAAGGAGTDAASSMESTPCATDMTAVLAIVRDIADICSLGPLVVVEPSMPLGYYCEMPATDADCALHSGNAHAQANWSRCGWQFLVALSGQCHAQLLHHLPAHSRWRQAMESQSDAGATQLQINLLEVSQFLFSPVLAGKFVQLWMHAQQWMQSDPKHLAMGPASNIAIPTSE